MTFIIIGSIVLAIIGYVIFNANKFTNIQITKSVTIEAPIDRVFDMVANQNNFHKWSPFLAKDPKLVYKVKEETGIVGTQLHWSGGKDGKDLGYQEVVKINKPFFVGLICDIQKPFEAKSTFNYGLAKNATNTIVTQTFDMESSMVSAIFMWIFGAKKEIESNNQLALDLLKKVSEKDI